MVEYAFPLHEDQRKAEHMEQRGLPIRDHIAIQVVSGLCANPGGPFQANLSNGWNLVNCTCDDVAETAYAIADAMMKARIPK